MIEVEYIHKDESKENKSYLFNRNAIKYIAQMNRDIKTTKTEIHFIDGSVKSFLSSVENAADLYEILYSDRDTASVEIYEI